MSGWWEGKEVLGRVGCADRRSCCAMGRRDLYFLSSPRAQHHHTSKKDPDPRRRLRTSDPLPEGGSQGGGSADQRGGPPLGRPSPFAPDRPRAGDREQDRPRAAEMRRHLFSRLVRAGEPRGSRGLEISPPSPSLAAIAGRPLRVRTSGHTRRRSGSSRRLRRRCGAQKRSVKGSDDTFFLSFFTLVC